MRDVVLFTLGETRCAVWRDHVSSVEDVGSLHHFPFLKTSLNVLAVIGERTRTLADLPACLGFAPTKERAGARALIMSDREPIQGFLVMGQPHVSQVPPESVVPVPGFLSLPGIQGCLNLDGQAVLILDVAALYGMVKDGSHEIGPPRNALHEEASQPEPQVSNLRAVRAGDCILTLPAAAVARSLLSGYHVVNFPLLPRDIDGIAVLPDRILPIVDLRSRIFPEAPLGTPVALEATVGKGSAALLVDQDGGEWSSSDTRIRELPPVTQSAWLHSAAVRNGEVAGLLDLQALLAAGPDAPREKNLTARHKPDSVFPSQFEREDVRVVEFIAHGRRHAVPESEAHAVIPAEPCRPVPLSPRIVAGVSDHEDALLPVLDFARLYDENAPARQAGSMIVIANGGFRALVMSDQVFDARSVGREEQREVPVALPYPVVYGCYTAGESVRLIFNIEALVSHSDEAKVTELVTALAPLQPIEPEMVRTAPGAEGTGPAETVVEAVVEEEPEKEAPAAPEEKPLPEWIELSEPLATAAAPPEAAPHETPPPAVAPPVAAAPPTAEELGIAEAPTLEEPEILEPPPAEPTGAAAGSIDIEEPKVAAHSSSEIRSALQASLVDEEDVQPEKPAEPKRAVSDAGPARTQAEVTPAEEAALVEPAARSERTWGRRVLGFVISAIVIAALGTGLYLARGFVQTQATSVAAAPAPAPAPAAAPAAQPSQPATPQPAATTAKPAPTTTFYVVKEGDTLWDISNRFTGNPFNYRIIAGQNKIQNPDLIFPGQEIQTPQESAPR
ncbi:MAG TPA: chemotaxis protein CheW [Spirochaetia bacterium]|nr:chemotaxis protein CheW [Spirochaetia bacterium]